MSYTLVINNGTGTRTETEYMDGACATPMVMNPSVFTFSLGTAVTLNGDVAGITSATELDITVTNPPPTETFYDIIALVGDSIYLGDSLGANDGTTPALRPTELDDEVVFVRQ